MSPSQAFNTWFDTILLILVCVCHVDSFAPGSPRVCGHGGQGSRNRCLHVQYRGTRHQQGQHARDKGGTQPAVSSKSSLSLSPSPYHVAVYFNYLDIHALDWDGKFQPLLLLLCIEKVGYIFGKLSYINCLKKNTHTHSDIPMMFCVVSSLF